MAKPKGKFYAVKQGRTTGIFNTWEECQTQIHQFPQAVYKSFTVFEEAQAWMKVPHIAKPRPAGAAAAQKPKPILNSATRPKGNQWAVDGACSGNPGLMEYQCVEIGTGKTLFKLQTPLPGGTNNIAEFLAIVHALALQKKEGICIDLYSDSLTAMSWVKHKKVRTNIERTAANNKIWELLDRALTWLNNNTWKTKILKWETKKWGENPADFGRK
jgi:ribonuclease HI